MQTGAKFFQYMGVHIAAKRRCGGYVFNEPCPPFLIRLFCPIATLQPRHPNSTMPIEMPSFYERGQSIEFDPPTTQRGFLPQVNEKLGQWIAWDVIKVGGDPHLPVFRCTPGRHG